MKKIKVALLVAVAFVSGFVLGIEVPRHRPAPPVRKLDVESAPSAAEVRAGFVRLEAQRMDDWSQSRVRVETRGLTNEYVLVLSPWHSAADLAEYPDLGKGAAYKEAAIDAPKAIGKVAVQNQMKKESLKRLGFVAVLATADRKTYWSYDVASDTWTLKKDAEVPW
jgi:hypothetical protein